MVYFQYVLELWRVNGRVYVKYKSIFFSLSSFGNSLHFMHAFKAIACLNRIHIVAQDASASIIILVLVNSFFFSSCYNIFKCVHAILKWHRHMLPNRGYHITGRIFRYFIYILSSALHVLFFIVCNRFFYCSIDTKLTPKHTKTY